MKTVTLESTVSLAELHVLAQERFGDFVKAVVDVKQNRMVIGGAMHADEEQVLLESGSSQEDLWGINLSQRFRATIGSNLTR